MNINNKRDKKEDFIDNLGNQEFVKKSIEYN